MFFFFIHWVLICEIRSRPLVKLWNTFYMKQLHVWFKAEFTRRKRWLKICWSRFTKFKFCPHDTTLNQAICSGSLVMLGPVQWLDLLLWQVSWLSCFSHLYEHLWSAPLSLLHLFDLQGQQINEAACDLAREVANEGDALVAGGVSQTPSYLSCKSEDEVKAIFMKQIEVFVKKNVDFLIAEVRSDLWPHCLNPCSSLWLQWHFKSDATSCFGHLGATETSCGQFLIKMTTAALKTITSGLWISCFVLYKVHSIFSGYFSWLEVCVVLCCSTLSTWKRPSGRSKSWRPPGSQWLRLCVSDLMEIWTESAPETVPSDSSTLVRQRLTSLSC